MVCALPVHRAGALRRAPGPGGLGRAEQSPLVGMGEDMGCRGDSKQGVALAAKLPTLCLELPEAPGARMVGGGPFALVGLRQELLCWDSPRRGGGAALPTPTHVLGQWIQLEEAVEVGL